VIEKKEGQRKKRINKGKKRMTKEIEE